MKAAKLLTALIEKTEVTPHHDVKDTLYEVELKCGIKVLLNADILHGGITYRQWKDFLELVAGRAGNEMG